MQQPVAKRRPNFNETVRMLLEDVSARVPEFEHIRPARLLILAGEARRASRGTVKPLTFPGGRSRDEESGFRRPIIRISGKRVFYTIALRPLFFRDSDAEGRIGTLLHELFHISTRFDGTLSDARRHASMGKEFAKNLRPIVRRYLKECPPELKARFAYDGEVRIYSWLERPGLFFFPGKDSSRRVYTEEQLYLCNVRMITAPSAPLPPPAKKKATKKKARLVPPLH